MITTTPGSSGIATTALASFDSTATRTFAWICRLVDGDRSLAEDVLADVYILLPRSTDGFAEVDGDWLITASFQIAESSRDGQVCGAGDLTLRERAVLDLRYTQRRSDAEIARIIGIAAADVATAVAAAEDVVRTSGAVESFADIFRRSEIWLDDSTRRRARAAIARGSRSGARRLPSSQSPAWQGAFGRSPEPIEGAAWAQQSAPSIRPTDLRSSRRLIVGVALGIAATLSAGVLWISSGDRGIEGSNTVESDVSAESAITTERAADTTSNETRSTIMRTVPSPRPPLVLSPGYILGEVPAGFEPNGAYEQAGGQGMGPRDGWFELWAEPGATRTSGRWFAIATDHSEYSFGLAESGTKRLSIDGASGLLTTEADGVMVVHLQVDAPARRRSSVEVIGFGMRADELQQLASIAGSNRTEPDGATASVPAAGLDLAQPAGAILEGMELLMSKPSVCCGVRFQLAPQGDVRSVSYRSASLSETGRYLSVTTRKLADDDDPFEGFFPAFPFDQSIPERELQIGGRTVKVNTTTFVGDTTDHVFNILTWTEGDQRIEMAGEVDVDALVAAVPGVRLAAATEWHELSQVEPVFDDFESSPDRGTYHAVGQATLPDGTSWRMLVNLDSNRIEWRMDGSASGGFSTEPFEVERLRPVHEYSSIGTTVLVIALRDVGAGTAVRVNVAGRAPVTIPLIQIDDSGVYAAMDAFSELPPYTVELVDDSGAALRLLAH